jgi:DNA replicative helicase MCM subunit Mcm2 (Cdc46/Mcm family)
MWLLLDEQNEENDSRLAAHIISVHQGRVGGSAAAAAGEQAAAGQAGGSRQQAGASSSNSSGVSVSRQAH